MHGKSYMEARRETGQGRQAGRQGKTGRKRQAGKQAGSTRQNVHGKQAGQGGQAFAGTEMHCQAGHGTAGRHVKQRR
jgi:hypothetical protein